MQRNNPYAVFLISLLAFVLIGCFVLYLLGAPAEAEVFSSITAETPFANEMELAMKLTSSAFEYGQPIPIRYSCKGDDVSPALAWDESPAGTKSLALIMDDPDTPVGTWVHWVLFNIPVSAHEWPENTPTDSILPNGAVQGITSARSHGYHGPCPPSGTHRYFFKLYALDTLLSLPSSASKADLLAAMEGHILAQAELMGTFSK
jgi:Raf kinase inhibitor-like YbhB/YbcL family protein